MILIMIENMIRQMLNKLFKNEKGQGMVEYILIIALVAAVLVGLFKLFGTQMSVLFTKAVGTISK